MFCYFCNRCNICTKMLTFVQKCNILIIALKYAKFFGKNSILHVFLYFLCKEQFFLTNVGINWLCLCCIKRFVLCFVALACLKYWFIYQLMLQINLTKGLNYMCFLNKKIITDEDLYSGPNFISKRHDPASLRAHLREVGFDFGLIGSAYLQDLLSLIIEKPMRLFYLRRIAMALVAEKHGISTEAVDRDIRWAIKRAKETGCFEGYSCFEASEPTAKRVITWLFDQYI